MVNDVIGGHVTSKFLKILCKKKEDFHQRITDSTFLLNMTKTKLSFGPNGRKIHKIYHCESPIKFWISANCPINTLLKTGTIKTPLN